MKLSQFIAIVAGIFMCAMSISFALPKHFPTIKSQTLDGKTINANYFANKKTVVIHMYLGCPGAMNAIKDIQAVQDSIPEDIQVLFILENTADQVREFNADQKTDWTMIREYFKLIPISQDVVAECDTPNIYKDENGNTVIGSQCNKLSKKLKIKSSPTFLYVDEDGKILKKESGYYAVPQPKLMWEKLTVDFN